jgi:transposase
MFYPLGLSETEKQTLQEAARNAPSYRFRQRAEALLAQDRGMSVTQLAQHYGRDRDTISRWIHAWEDRGVAGLFEPPRSGRPPKLQPVEKKAS